MKQMCQIGLTSVMTCPRALFGVNFTWCDVIVYERKKISPTFITALFYQLLTDAQSSKCSSYFQILIESFFSGSDFQKPHKYRITFKNKMEK